MIDSRQVPFLVKLLDDDSKEIQEKIAKELASFGPILKDELRKIDFSLNPTQLHHIHGILQGQKIIWLKRQWAKWFYLKSDHEKLEMSLGLLSEFLEHSKENISIHTLLDELAQGYQERFTTVDPKNLAQFLFKEEGIRGNEQDYYNPQNSNLFYVIRQKKGIPISLTSIYMLVGGRLGLKIEGCNFPGHFLARVNDRGRKIFIDCFNHGRTISGKDIIRARKDLSQEIEIILYEPIDAETIIRRYLTNLITAFQMQAESENRQLMMEFFKSLEARITEKEIRELTPDEIIADTRPLFDIGQVVRHRKNGYRAIIVDVDMFYKSSPKESDGEIRASRHQPWFHILVDHSDQVKYVPESSLREDDSPQKIDHPLLSYFFTQSSDGQYVRNGNPWPNTDA